MGRITRLMFIGAAVVTPFIGSSPPADAHGGGLDGTGGHHCRQAGYDSGKCAPLNSYHCHQSPCGEAAPATTTTTLRRTTTTTTAPLTTTTTQPTTTTTAEATTTTTTTTTTTEATTTTTEVTPATASVSAEKDVDDEPTAAETIFTLGVLGAAGYGGVRFYRRARRRLPQG